MLVRSLHLWDVDFGLDELARVRIIAPYDKGNTPTLGLEEIVVKTKIVPQSLTTAVQ